MDMKVLGVWEPYVVKTQTIKTAIESATVLLRIDDIVSGIQKKNKPGPGQTPGPQVDDPDQVYPCPYFTSWVNFHISLMLFSNLFFDTIKQAVGIS